MIRRRLAIYELTGWRLFAAIALRRTRWNPKRLSIDKRAWRVREHIA